MAGMHLAPSSILTVLAAWPDHPDAVRSVPAWAGHPILGPFSNAAEAALAARHPGDDKQVLAALAARRDDPVATLAALGALAPSLQLIAARWERAGLTGADLADAESDLVTECLALLRSDPYRPGPAVVQGAWHRVNGRRRTARARAARQVPFDADSLLLSRHRDRGPLRDLQDLLAEGVADGTVSRLEAQSVWAVATGWTTSEACAVTGCSPPAWRARRCRAIRALAASVGEVA